MKPPRPSHQATAPTASYLSCRQDKSGEIELEELKGACRLLGAKESDAEAMLEAYDTE
jgi:hypothetical protein